MEKIPNYNLLQAIDPTKIKVPISDRFAKLTLSSNKKQRPNDHEQKEDLEKEHEKWKRVSRDISKEFESEVPEMMYLTGQNPLLRSESSKETEQNNSLSQNDDTECEITMEPLKVSQDYDNPTQLDNDLELLSGKVASMAVVSRPISISSGSTDNLNNKTQLVSVESQRSSTSDENHLHIVHNIPVNVREVLKQETTFMNINNSTSNDDMEKTYEMTDYDDEDLDDEYDDDDEEEGEAITISDTSESDQEQEGEVMATSSAQSTSQTEGLLLPCLTEEKAERVAAFLRDVSIERRAMMEYGGQVDINDTIDQFLDNRKNDKIQETLNKSRQIATADTESITPDANEEITPKFLIERDKRLKALDELLPEGPDDKEESKNLTEDEEEEVEELEENNKRLGQKNVGCIRHDETQNNTIITDNAYELDIEKTPNILTYSKSIDNDIYKLANNKTDSNLEFSISELIETPKIHTNFNNNTLKQRNPRRLSSDIETEENTIKPLTENNTVTPKKRAENDPRRLVKDDTLVNSMTSIGEFTSQAYDYSHDYKSPNKTGKTYAKSSVSLHSTPQSYTSSYHNQDSIINSPSKLNVSIPEESIIISETDEESVEHKQSSEIVNSDDNKKLSNSFHNNDDSSDSSNCNRQMSQLQMSMASINISAKINIKIHIPTTTSPETSDDGQNYEDDTKEDKRKDKNPIPKKKNCQETNTEYESNDQSLESNPSDNELSKPCNQMQTKVGNEIVLNCSDKSTNSVEVLEDEKFLTGAEKLLTQLYGESWQTPEIIRTLKRSTQSENKKSNDFKTSPKKKNYVKSSKDRKQMSGSKPVVEESILDDFSIFQRNIVKTNLDSTRLVTPKTCLRNREIFTAPRNVKPLMFNDKAETRTVKKSLRPMVAKVVSNNNRWRQLIDDDSNYEGDNASDDDDADESWSKIASEIEDNFDSDFENSPRPKGKKGRNNTTKCIDRNDLARKLNKSKEGEIVYLDLSKEEVEIQEVVPESPPANHDVTFASRLQNILESCRHEDKAKLPSSTKRTKRKLFTPNFGDDDFESTLPNNEEQIVENTAKDIKKVNNDDEVLEDYDNFPFDSKGRPKVLNFFNKQLESVKTGKPIFQLTPYPKNKGKSTPLSTKHCGNSKERDDDDNIIKSKTDNENKFKTPLTIKSKGTPKSLRELCATPDYKYGFLKSLDVTVSKSLCHPDALYYRDNYRTKKEDLSKILYDMYNEKLFNNKLEVSLTWNKKLSNTAGRCLNKKKMGIRLSVIELSDKVLTSADRLRCTLIHEMCHAATWIFNGEGGHGNTWKEWARRANIIFPEIPKIGVCHQYNIEYKYTYKCTLCAAKSHAHSKSKKVENIRCSYCHGAIEIFLNKKDKDGNIMPTPVKEPTGFAKFVKDNYKKFKRDDLKHADVMKLLSSEFASLKVTTN